MTRGSAPAYLGRVLNADRTPVGTCFQVAPGVLVTAWHVLSRVGAGRAGDVVSVDAMATGAPGSVRVRVVDELRDLAVMVGVVPWTGSVEGLVASETVAALTDLVMSGLPSLV